MAIGTIIGVVLSVAQIAEAIVATVKCVEEFVNIAAPILKEFGIINSDETPVELGDKALQAKEQGIVPEKFDAYGKYLKAVENFAVNPDKSALIDERSKLVEGAQVMTAALLDRFSGKIDRDFFSLIGNGKSSSFFEGRMPYFTDMQKKDSSFFSDITRFITGREGNIEKGEATLGKMFEIEKKVNPNASVSGLLKSIGQITN